MWMKLISADSLTKLSSMCELLKCILWRTLACLGLMWPTAATRAEPPPRPLNAGDVDALRKLADAADLVAQFWLAVDLSSRGNPDDQREAIRRMKSAADYGAPFAQFELGQWYRRGFLVEASESECQRYWLRAANRGYPEAMVMMAAQALDRRTPTSLADAEAWLEKAERAGSWMAFATHAKWLESGLGFALNERQAAEKWLAAGKLGSYEAGMRLARHYYEGRVVQQDFAKCEAWLRRAAHGGGVEALLALARFLSSCPEEKWRDRQEAYLLVREAEVIAGDELDCESLMVVASLQHACGQGDAATSCLIRARRALNGGRPGGAMQELDRLSLLNQLEKAVKLGRPFEWPAPRPYNRAKPLVGDSVLEGRSFERLPPKVEPHVGLWWLSGPIMREEFEEVLWNDPLAPLYDDEGYEIERVWLVSEEDRWRAVYRSDGAEVWERAKKGDYEAALEMARRLIARTDDEAIQRAGVNILQDTAERGGYPPALRELASMHETGYLVPQGLETAKRLYQQAAGAGDAESMFALGKMYEVGVGASRDPAAAAHWLRRAVVYGHSGAMNLLAEKLMEGRGVRIDPGAGYLMLVEAAGSGYPESQLRLGRLHSVAGNGRAADLASAKFWLEMAAKNGLVEAQFQLAVLHYDGRIPDAKRSDAAKWALASAQGYYLPGVRMMAWLYLMGEGVPRDYQRAEAWMRRAATYGAGRDLATLADYLVTCPEERRRNPKEAIALAERVLEMRGTEKGQFGLRTWEELGRALAASGRWQEAVDCEQAAYAAINEMREMDVVTKSDRLRQSLRRSGSYLQGTMPLLPAPPEPEPGTKPLFDDTILQETEDKLAPMRDEPKPRDASPNFPWEMDVS